MEKEFVIRTIISPLEKYIREANTWGMSRSEGRDSGSEGSNSSSEGPNLKFIKLGDTPRLFR